jgi:hypothetical protein
VETWNVFSASDVAYAFLGFSGLVSVVVVLKTAFGNVNTRERKLKNR